MGEKGEKGGIERCKSGHRHTPQRDSLDTVVEAVLGLFEH